LIEHVGILNIQVRTILDIDCGYGSFGAHLFQSQLLTMCIASYEPSGSQVQLTLERGLPAMVASFNSKQLPFPSLSFDMLHCARCGIDWDRKGIFENLPPTIFYKANVIVILHIYSATPKKMLDYDCLWKEKLDYKKLRKKNRSYGL